MTASRIIQAQGEEVPVTEAERPSGARTGDPLISGARVSASPAPPCASPYEEPPRGAEVRWVPVADLHLPLGVTAIAAIVDALSDDLPTRQLVARTPSDDPETLQFGYYVGVAL
jgi:hypothetical protein